MPKRDDRSAGGTQPRATAVPRPACREHRSMSLCRARRAIARRRSRTLAGLFLKPTSGSTFRPHGLASGSLSLFFFLPPRQCELMWRRDQLALPEVNKRSTRRLFQWRCQGMRLLFLLLDGADPLQRQRAALYICRTKSCWNRHRGTAGGNARLGTTLLTSRVEPGYSHTARQSGGAPQLKTKHILRSPFSSVCVSAWPARLAFATHTHSRVCSGITQTRHHSH